VRERVRATAPGALPQAEEAGPGRANLQRMPIVIVRSLRPAAPQRIDDMLAGIVRELAGALGDSPGDVWVYWEDVQAVRLGERAVGFEGHCPLVTVRARAGRPQTQIAAGLAAVARAVCESLAIPLEDVWAHWEELPPGRVFAGGGLL